MIDDPDDASALRSGGDELDLVPAIGHELRNIVGAIIHQIELLAGGGLEETMRARSRAAIVESAEELNRFVDAVTDLEQLQRGELVAARRPVDLVDLLESIVSESGWATIERRNSSLSKSVRVGDVEPSEVLVDPVTIRRVLTIAIAESLERIGAVEISAAREGDYVHISFDSVDGPIAGHRVVCIDDGLGLWVASQLARLSNARLETTASGTSMRLTLWVVAADESREHG